VFIKDYQKEGLFIAQTINSAKRDVKKRLDNLAAERLSPIVNKLFIDGVAASNQIMKAEIVRLSDVLQVPFKYNKDLIEKINGDSLFVGFYDKNYKDLYTRREIDLLKRRILSAKYQGLTDREMAEYIQGTINTTKQRALITARLETQRLDGAAQQIFYEQPKVKEEYEKVWVHNSDYDRHKKYSGIVANKDGFFEQAGVYYAPPLDSPINCVCSTILRKIK
jgi:hypothetical protein